MDNRNFLYQLLFVTFPPAQLMFAYYSCQVAIPPQACTYISGSSREILAAVAASERPNWRRPVRSQECISEYFSAAFPLPYKSAEYSDVPTVIGVRGAARTFLIIAFRRNPCASLLVLPLHALRSWLNPWLLARPEYKPTLLYRGMRVISFQDLRWKRRGMGENTSPEIFSESCENLHII